MSPPAKPQSRSHNLKAGSSSLPPVNSSSTNQTPLQPGDDSSTERDFFRELGRTFINAAGTYTLLNASLMLARDGLFFSRFAEVNAGSHVPVWSIIIQAVWGSVLAFSGSYDQLTDYVIFASWIFYAMTKSAVFVLRRKMPDATRPYKTLGYPLIPMVFVLVASWLTINTLVARPVESATGLLLIALGLPVFAYYRYRRQLKSKSS